MCPASIRCIVTWLRRLRQSKKAMLWICMNIPSKKVVALKRAIVVISQLTLTAQHEGCCLTCHCHRWTLRVSADSSFWLPSKPCMGWLSWPGVWWVLTPGQLEFLLQVLSVSKSWQDALPDAAVVQHDWHRCVHVDDRQIWCASLRGGAIASWWWKLLSNVHIYTWWAVETKFLGGTDGSVTASMVYIRCALSWKLTNADTHWRLVSSSGRQSAGREEDINTSVTEDDVMSKSLNCSRKKRKY